MNRDPFLRLALIACCSAYMLGVFVVWDWLGADTAVAVLITGIALAGLLTYERVPEPDEPAEDLRQRRRQPAEGTRGFERIE